MEDYKTIWVAGVDEVGRGPLAGPVVAAAVILDPQKPIMGLRDSKKLSPKARFALNGSIHEQALAVSIAFASVEEIDQLNILKASLLAMMRAVQALTRKPHLVRIDGPHPIPHLQFPMETHIGGDDLFAEISAASIVAKVYRDQWMEQLALEYPEYGFEQHAGYPTQAHLKALRTHGPCPIHRRSFGPVKRVTLRSAAPISSDSS